MMDGVWPVAIPDSRLDRMLGRIGRAPGFCNICGRAVIFNTREPNFREHVICSRCKSVNRYRQIMRVLLAEALGKDGSRFASTRSLPSGLAIWNAENTRALHEALKAHPDIRYVSSEFIDPALKSGAQVDGVLHVDMQKTHFAGESLDYVLSSDVMEHVPDYMQALREIYRVLKVGGAHIFTAPFYTHRSSIERRSTLGADGTLNHARKPWYHGAPLRPEGVLCYNVFAIELLSEMECIGYQARLLRLHDPLLGILGSNGYVFVAKKVKPARKDFDLIFNEIH